MTPNTTTLDAKASMDMELRSFMLAVYNRMFGSLLFTALLAWIASLPAVSPLLFQGVGSKMHYTLLGWVCALGPIFLLLTLGVTKNFRSRTGTTIGLWGTAGLFGLSFGVLFLRYTGMSLGMTFATTAAAFGSLSLFGYTTKMNLTGWGSFLLIALFGLIIVMLAAAFMGDTHLDTLMSAAGVLIFAGFTAYDTQQLKSYYGAGSVPEARAVAANIAALNLYLDFINLFLFLLQFMGMKKND